LPSYDDAVVTAAGGGLRERCKLLSGIQDGRHGI